MFHNGITMHGAKHVKYSKTLTMFNSMQEILGSKPSQVPSVISHRALTISPSSVAISGQTSCLPLFYARIFSSHNLFPTLNILCTIKCLSVKKQYTYFELKSILDCITCFKLFVTYLNPEYIIKISRMLP